MRQLRACFIVILASLFTFPAFAQPEDPQVRREIEAVYAKWDKLVSEGNIKGLLSMVDPSFVNTDAEGKTSDYEAAKKQFASMFKSIRSVKSRIVVNQVQSQGNEVVAWVTMKMTFLSKSGKKWVPGSFTGKFAETFRKTGGGWKFVASQELPLN